MVKGLLTSGWAIPDLLTPQNRYEACNACKLSKTSCTGGRSPLRIAVSSSASNSCLFAAPYFTWKTNAVVDFIRRKSTPRGLLT